jgi:folate-binding protein YgfZ
METTATALALATPLAQFHQSAGAKLGTWFGCALPDDFGDWQREYSFARNSVALIDTNYRAYISFTGPDRVRYLNAILTNNVKDLPVSHGIVSLLLNAQGHILAEIETHACTDKLFCISYAMIRERLIPTLDKYIIMDDVTLTDDTERFGTLALEGPTAATLVRELTGVDLSTLDELGSAEINVGAIPCTVVKRTPGAHSGAEFLTERQHLESLWKLLEAKTRAHGGGPLGYTAFSALRLEQGVPWFGYDFGEKQIPHEAGLQDTHLSFTKGCYTGQEIVERVRSRGQVNRQRVGLVFAGSASTAFSRTADPISSGSAGVIFSGSAGPALSASAAPAAGEIPAAGEALSVGGNEIGYVTRTAWSPMLSARIGMGYVRREHSAPGTQLQWRHGAATVAKFPLKAPQK